MSRPVPNLIRTEILKTLIERGVLSVALYADCMQISGGHDSDELVMQLDGEFSAGTVASWFGIDPAYVDIQDAGMSATQVAQGGIEP